MRFCRLSLRREGVLGICRLESRNLSPRLDRAVSKGLNRLAGFSPKCGSACRVFFSNANKDSPCSLFRSPWKIFFLSAAIRAIFASLLELSIHLSTTLTSSRLRHSLESTLATAPARQLRITRRVGSYFWLCTCLVSRTCRAGAVANVWDTCYYTSNWSWFFFQALPIINTQLFRAGRKNMKRKGSESERAGRKERKVARKKFETGNRKIMCLKFRLMRMHQTKIFYICFT